MEIDWAEISNVISEFVVTWGIRVVGVLVALFFAWVFAGWAQRTINSRLSKRLDASVVKFFASLIKYGILAVAVIGCLGVFGIQTASFAAVLAAAGLAIGLAFQGTLSNFASGVMLLVFRPFKVDDLVNVADQLGKVTTIDLFTTEMTTPDNRRVVIPNSEIFGSVIDNYTHHDTRRIGIDVGVDYSADVDEVRKVLETVPPQVEGALKDPAPQIFLSSLGASSVDWQVRVWCNTPDYWDVYQETIRVTKKTLDEAGISIPFPQQDVHFDADVVEAFSKK